MIQQATCWCGNTVLRPFSADYLRCAACETLVVAEMPEAVDLLVQDDDRDFYGKHYFEQVQASHGLPPLAERMRADLPERCLFWLRGLLKYKLPPAQVLELGSAHGGFVAMMRWAGFDASGLELSPFVADLARRTFGIPMLIGPVESQEIPARSLDAIIAMDVLEHLGDPLATLQHCAGLLKDDGIFFLQTPQYREGKSLEQMEAEGDPFLQMLKPDQHLYLFSRSSVRQLLGRAGIEEVSFEPAIFSSYDMALVAASKALTVYSEAASLTCVESRSSGRMLLALMDLDRRAQNLQASYAEAQAAYASQVQALEIMGERYAESEADRAARLQNMLTLEKMVKEAQAALTSRQEDEENKNIQLAELDEARNQLMARCEALQQSLAESEAQRTAESQSALRAHREIETAHSARLAQAEQALAARIDELSALCGALRSRLSDTYGLLLEHKGQLAESEIARIAAVDENGILKGQLRGAEEQRKRTAMMFDRLHGSYIYRLMRKLGLWAWMDPESLPEFQRSPVEAERGEKKLRRVAVDLTPVLPGGENGGAKIMTLELIKQLSRIAQDCEFVLLTSEKSHDELASLDASNIRRLCVNTPGAALSKMDNTAVRIRRMLTRLVSPAVLQKLAGAYREISQNLPSGGGLLRQLEADLLFCPFTAAFFFDPAVPLVSVVYDLQHVYYPQFFDSAEVEQRNRNIDRACRVASRIVCISEYVRRTVLENLKASPERVETIHIQASRRLPEPLPSACNRVLKDLGLRAERFLIYPANYWQHKNHELLLTAFGMYRARQSDAGLKLVLTGAPGARRDFLKEASCRMGLDEAVVFAGFLPEEDFSALMTSCLAVIFPSLFEGFGMPLLEAMAAGKPVLCSNLTSLPEVAGDAALFFDPRKPVEIAEAITRVENDDSLRRELSIKGSQRLSVFGEPKDMAARYLKVFHDAINSQREAEPGVYGVFEDGWLGERVTIVFGSGKGSRNLIATLEIPGWAPLPRVSARVLVGNRDSHVFEILRGQPVTFELPIPTRAGTIEFSCSPAFRPKEFGIGDDSRQLTCQFRSAEITGDNGVTTLRSQAYAA